MAVVSTSFLSSGLLKGEEKAAVGNTGILAGIFKEGGKKGGRVLLSCVLVLKFSKKEEKQGAS